MESEETPHWIAPDPKTWGGLYPLPLKTMGSPGTLTLMGMDPKFCTIPLPLYSSGVKKQLSPY